jgi:Na+-transporting methylmalonyl-CoA/oxaloacetate decarboxylase gamma subunit
MKNLKLLVAFMLLFSSLGLSAQVKIEKKAQKLADEMTQVLSLNKEESKAIYEIQLERFIESQTINEEFADDPEMKKEKLKELGNKVFNQTKKVLGVERQKQWQDYKSKNK